MIASRASSGTFPLCSLPLVVELHQFPGDRKAGQGPDAQAPLAHHDDGRRELGLCLGLKGGGGSRRITT